MAASTMRRRARVRDAVRLSEGEIDIPTYEMGPPNPWPYFGRDREVYPYAPHGFEYRTATPRRRRYTLLTLENRYLRVTVLPELGGRIHAMTDKTNGHRNVLYTDAVKMIRGGIGFNYAGMGLEMNFPDAHSITNVRPRNYATAREADGGASVTVWEIEWIGRCQWSYSFILRPDSARLEMRVQVFNGTPWPRRMRYWANPAIPSDDSTEFIFPERLADMHGGGHGEFTWPRYLGMDLSKFKNNQDVLGLYFLGVRQGFFGYYNHEPGYGLVHAADAWEVPGKKVWTWGHCQMGLSRVTFYGGPYSEVQSGRLENQDHFDWLQPGKSFHWVEYWYPVKQMEGFRWANEHAAIQARTEESGVRVQVHVTRPCARTEVRLCAGGRSLAAVTARLDPSRTWQGVLRMKSALPPRGDATLIVADLTPGGGVIAECALAEDDPKARAVVRMGESITRNEGEKNAETLTLRADWFARSGKWPLVEKLLRAALVKDPDYSPAHRQLALLHIRRGGFAAAREHLDAALRRNEFDALALAWLGETHLLEGRLDDAERRFLSAARHGQEALGYGGAGRVRMRRGRAASAVEPFERALEYDTRDLRLLVRLAAARRKMGDSSAARAALDAAHRLDPTDLLARFERVQLLRLTDVRGAKRMIRAIRDSVRAELPEQYWIETAFFYRDIACLDEAVEAAEIACDVASRRGAGGPMAHYLLAHLLSARDGGGSQAERQYRRAAACLLDFACPARPEEAALLHDLMAARPRDPVPPYLLGNLRSAFGDEKGALEAWDAARKRGLSYAGLERNAAWAHLKFANDPRRALAHYRRALRLRPDDVHLRVECCQVLRRMGRHDALCRLLEERFDMTARSQSLSGFLVEAHAAIGRPEKVLDVQSRLHLEGWDYLHEGYRKDACTAIAKKHLEAGRYDAAIRALKAAWELPRNLGTGAVTLAPTFARERYYLGLAYAAQGKDDRARQEWEEAVREPHRALYRTIDDEYAMWHTRVWQARCLKKLGRLEEANVYFDGLIEFSKLAAGDSARKVYPDAARRIAALAEEARVAEGRVLAATLGLAAEA